MCLWDREAIAEEKRLGFIRALAVALNTGRLLQARHCDQETNFALYDLVKSWPDATPELVESAWTAFEGQFNGANNAKQKAWWDSEFARRMADSGWADS
jgi:hypothetical protein